MCILVDSTVGTCGCFGSFKGGTVGFVGQFVGNVENQVDNAEKVLT